VLVISHDLHKLREIHVAPLMMSGRAASRTIGQFGAEVRHREILSEARHKLGEPIPALPFASRARYLNVARTRSKLAKQNATVLTHRMQAPDPLRPQ